VADDDIFGDIIGSGAATTPAAPAPSAGTEKIDPNNIFNLTPEEMQGASTENPSYLSDIAKSVAVAPLKAAASAAGFFGDLPRAVVDPALRFITGKELPEIPEDKRPRFQIPGPPTSEQIRGAAGKMTGMELYEPKTRPGEMASTVTEALTNPFSYAGPGALGTKALSALGAGIGTAAGGEAAERAGLEGGAKTAAEFAGGMLGGFEGGRRAAARAEAKYAAKLPKQEELPTTSTNHFKAARAEGVELNAAPLRSLADGIRAKLESQDIFKEQAPAIYKILDQMSLPQGATGYVPVSLGRVISWWRGANFELLGEGPSTVAAHVLQNDLNNFIDKVVPANLGTHMVNPDAAKLKRAIDEYRLGAEDWGAYMRSSRLTEQLERGEMAAATSGSGANVDNAIRQKIAAIRKSPELRAGYSDEEMSLLEDIYKGTDIRNRLRKIGKLAPHGTVSSLPYFASILTGHTPAAIAFAAGTQGAKELGDYLTRRSVETLDRALLSRSAEARKRGITGPAPQDPFAAGVAGATRALGPAAMGSPLFFRSRTTGQEAAYPENPLLQ